MITLFAFVPQIVTVLTDLCCESLDRLRTLDGDLGGLIGAGRDKSVHLSEYWQIGVSGFLGDIAVFASRAAWVDDVNFGGQR